MGDNINLTLPETAQKIVGKDNFISLEEARSIFPNEIINTYNLDLVPFSEKLLFHCSEAEQPFILFPAFPAANNLPLTIKNLRNYIMKLKRWDLFLPFSKDLELRMPSFINKITCQPRWYLLSRKVLEINSLKKFCAENEYTYKNFRAAPAVVYIYAWLLFRLIRKETLFLEDLLHTGDKYADRIYAGMAYLNFKAGKIGIGNLVNPIENLKDIGYSPSVDPYTE